MYSVQEYKYSENESSGLSKLIINILRVLLRKPILMALECVPELFECHIHLFFRSGRDFCLETSIHGFNHIAVPRRHWIERVLWAVTTAAAIWGAMNLSLGQLQRFQDSPTVITLEKDFRTWLFSTPAITYCEMNRVDPAKLPQAISSRWKVGPEDEKYSYYAKFVATVANSDLLHLQEYEEFKGDSNLDLDLYMLVFEVMPALQVKTTWSTSVAVRWFPVLTEAGACYATNSLALADVAYMKPTINDTKKFPVTCQYSALSCYVILEIETKGTFYVHSPYDVMDVTTGASSVFPSLNRVTDLSVMETRCGRGVRDLAPQRRACLFTDETVSKGKAVYSTNTCRLSCRSKLAVKLCGCRPFYYIHEEGPVCNPAGMQCLSQHALLLVSNGGAKCACSPQCLEATFREIANHDEIWAKGPLSGRGAVRFTVQAPHTRYTREIVFYFQDLVVSFGGAAGLFLGASFISFVEIFYFLLERTMRPCVKTKEQNTTKVEQIKPKKPAMSYEAQRIMELNTILENERRFEAVRF